MPTSASLRSVSSQTKKIPLAACSWPADAVAAADVVDAPPVDAVAVAAARAAEPADVASAVAAVVAAALVG